MSGSSGSDDAMQKIAPLLLIRLRKKYDLFHEIMNCTKDMEDALHRNDEGSLELILSLRQEAMLAVDELKEQMQKQMQTLSETEQEHMRRLLAFGEESPTLTQEWETQIWEASQRSYQLLKKICVIDNELLRKVMGT